MEMSFCQYTNNKRGDEMKQIYFYGNTAQCQCDKQEDAIFMSELEDYYILMIADGNGGQAGDINTGQLAINIMYNYLQKIITPYSSLQDIRDSMDFGMFIVSQSFLSINAISEKYRNIYASLAVVIISKTTQKMMFASTGNTELQLIRNGKLQRINRIYSDAYEALQRGEIEERDFYVHPGRSMLTSAIGVFPEVSADIMLFGELQEKDIFILSTDGVYRYLNPDEVISILGEASNIQEGVNQILTEINDKGGEDNASLIVGHLFNQ